MSVEIFNTLIKRIEKLEEEVFNIKNTNKRDRLEDLKQLYTMKEKELDSLDELICDIEDDVDIFEEDSEIY